MGWGRSPSLLPVQRRDPAKQGAAALVPRLLAQALSSQSLRDRGGAAGFSWRKRDLNLLGSPRSCSERGAAWRDLTGGDYFRSWRVWEGLAGEENTMHGEWEADWKRVGKVSQRDGSCGPRM